MRSSDEKRAARHEARVGTASNAALKCAAAADGLASSPLVRLIGCCVGSYALDVGILLMVQCVACVCKKTFNKVAYWADKCTCRTADEGDDRVGRRRGADEEDNDEEEEEEEAALDALLDDAATLVGGRRGKRRRFQEPASGSDVSDEEGAEGADAKYADFFGSAASDAAPRRRRQPRSGAAGSAEEEEDDIEDKSGGHDENGADHGEEVCGSSCDCRRVCCDSVQINVPSSLFLSAGKREWDMQVTLTYFLGRRVVASRCCCEKLQH